MDNNPPQFIECGRSEVTLNLADGNQSYVFVVEKEKEIKNNSKPDVIQLTERIGAQNLADGTQTHHQITTPKSKRRSENISYYSLVEQTSETTETFIEEIIVTFESETETSTDEGEYETPPEDNLLDDTLTEFSDCDDNENDGLDLDHLRTLVNNKKDLNKNIISKQLAEKEEYFEETLTQEMADKIDLTINLPNGLKVTSENKHAITNNIKNDQEIKITQIPTEVEVKLSQIELNDVQRAPESTIEVEFTPKSTTKIEATPELTIKIEITPETTTVVEITPEA